MTVSYVVDGKTYTYELDDSAVLNSINLDSLDLSNIRFIDWNSGFDNPISMPQGFGDGSAGSFDLRYQNTLNAMSYLGNLSKATNKEDFDRWYGKFKDTIYNELIYETNILTKEVERFKNDYGNVTNPISEKLDEVVTVANEAKKLLAGFASMASIVAVLTEITAVLIPLGAILGAIIVIDSTVKKQELPQREKAILLQAQKVQNLIEAYKSDALYNSLNRFETKVPKPVTGSNDNPFSDLYVVALIILLVFLLYKFINR